MRLDHLLSKEMETCTLVLFSLERSCGALAQLGERLLCTQEVCGSIPHSSTIFTANTRKLQSEPEKVHCEVLLFKNLDQAEN